MNKIKLEFTIPQSVVVMYNNQEVMVNPFLSLSAQLFLIRKYVEDFLTQPEGVEKIPGTRYNYFIAEANLAMRVLEICTNIDRSSITNDLVADVEFYWEVISKINGFEAFSQKLNNIVNEIKEQDALDKSVGSVIKEISVKAFDFLDSLPNMDPEELKTLAGQNSELFKKLSDSPLMGTAKPRKTRKAA